MGPPCHLKHSGQKTGPDFITFFKIVPNQSHTARYGRKEGRRRYAEADGGELRPGCDGIVEGAKLVVADAREDMEEVRRRVPRGLLWIGA